MVAGAARISNSTRPPPDHSRVRTQPAPVASSAVTGVSVGLSRGSVVADGPADTLAEGSALGSSVGASSGCTLHGGASPVWTLGVGSNRTQPQVEKYSSGQACMSLTDTSQESPTCSPGRKPIATREGIPATRAIMAIAEANCSQ